ncbi:MAG TPA: hypothetical protein P5532_19385, partial [Planctomycetota bacterium]|nr:hypothetical protein [Planctomycetota bacterium]
MRHRTRWAVGAWVLAMGLAATIEAGAPAAAPPAQEGAIRITGKVGGLDVDLTITGLTISG